MSEDSKSSITKALGTLTALSAAFVAVIVLYIFLGDKPLGIQIASLITYTGAVFFFLFCDSRWWSGYSLRTKTVQQKLPRLLGIHVAFLVCVFSVESIALYVRPRLPSQWLVERGVKHDSLFVDGLLLICALVLMTQILISRRILSRDS